MLYAINPDGTKIGFHNNCNIYTSPVIDFKGIILWINEINYMP
jgi:hypothetical protein